MYLLIYETKCNASFVSDEDWDDIIYRMIDDLLVSIKLNLVWSIRKEVKQSRKMNG